MPPRVKLSSAIPDENLNGLFTDAMLTEFLANPNRTVLVVGLLTNARNETNNETGTTTPILKFRHLEAVTKDHDHYGLVAEVLSQEHQRRTGEMMLPFEPGSVWAMPGGTGDADTEE